MTNPETLWAEFNGRNHAELAIKYQLSIQQVYAGIRQAHAQSQRPDRIKALEAVLTGLATNANLPANLLAALAQQAWSLKAHRIFLHLQWRRLNARLFGASLSDRLHRRQSKRSLNIPAGSVALRLSSLFHSLFNSH